MTSVDLTCSEAHCEALAGSAKSGHRCPEHYAEDLQRRIAATKPEPEPPVVKPVKPVRPKPKCAETNCLKDSRYYKAGTLCAWHYQQKRKASLPQ